MRRLEEGFLKSRITLSMFPSGFVAWIWAFGLVTSSHVVPISTPSESALVPETIRTEGSLGKNRAYPPIRSGYN